jgi:hypothetical protein
MKIGWCSAADAILRRQHAGFVGHTLEEVFPALIPTELPATYRRLAREGGMYR